MGFYIGLRLAPNTFFVADSVAPGTDSNQAPTTFDSIQALGAARGLDWHACVQIV
jgi:hypothetical protein